MEKEKIAIIVPFIRLNNYVLECIHGCLNLNYENHKIILIPDEEIHLPESLRSNRIVVIPSGAVRIPQKRNLWIKRDANADFYAFIDSDAYPEKKWLINALERFSKNPEIWAVGGPNICPLDDPMDKKAVGNALKSFLVLGNRAFRKKISKNRFCEDIPTCNLIIRRSVIDSIGLFNENLATGEDVDLCNRIVEHKGAIFFDNKVIVFHHNRGLFMPFFLQRFTFGFSTVTLIKQKFRLTNLFFFIPLLFLLLMFFGGILAFFNRTVFHLWLSILLIYLTAVLVESIRHMDSASEFPMTFEAMLTGNLVPGLGTLFALLGGKVDMRKIYKNY